jgi:hypothetical protein
MGQAPIETTCCSVMAQRVWGFYHQEDRRHMRTGISRSTGQPYAQSRTEERVIENQMGADFVMTSEIPDNIKFAKEYGAHLKAGKDPLPPDVAAKMMSAPPEKTVTVLEALQKSGVRLGEIPTDRYIGGKPLPAFPTDVKPESYDAG